MVILFRATESPLQFTTFATCRSAAPWWFGAHPGLADQGEGIESPLGAARLLGPEGVYHGHTVNL